MSSLLARLFGERRSSKLASSHPRDPVVASWWGGGAETASGVAVTADIALQSGAVYACVRALAEPTGWLPLIVYKRGVDESRQRDRQHRVSRLLNRRPNRWQTPYEFREMLTGHAALRGVGYAEVIATGGNPAAELVPLHPDRVRAFMAPDKAIAYEYSPPDGPPRVILGSEMFRLAGFSGDLLRPLSPISLHRETVGLDLAARRYGARLFRNDARPPGIIKHPSHFEDDEAFTRFRNSWHAAQTGVNQHKVAVLEDGMAYEQIGMTAEDAQYLESRNANAVDIARIFRLPPHKIGILDRATFSNIEQQALEFVTDTMMPWFTRWEQAVERTLFTPANMETHFVEFLIDGLLRADVKARSEFYRKGILDGWLNRNEVRRMENRNPVEGLDEYLVPQNMAPADMLKEILGGDANEPQ